MWRHLVFYFRHVVFGQRTSVLALLGRQLAQVLVLFLIGIYVLLSTDGINITRFAETRSKDGISLQNGENLDLSFDQARFRILPFSMTFAYQLSNVTLESPAPLDIEKKFRAIGMEFPFWLFHRGHNRAPRLLVDGTKWDIARDENQDWYLDGVKVSDWLALLPASEGSSEALKIIGTDTRVDFSDRGTREMRDLDIEEIKVDISRNAQETSLGITSTAFGAEDAHVHLILSESDAAEIANTRLEFLNLPFEIFADVLPANSKLKDMSGRIGASFEFDLDATRVPQNLRGQFSINYLGGLAEFDNFGPLKFLGNFHSADLRSFSLTDLVALGDGVSSQGEAAVSLHREEGDISQISLEVSLDDLTIENSRIFEKPLPFKKTEFEAEVHLEDGTVSIDAGSSRLFDEEINFYGMSQSESGQFRHRYRVKASQFKLEDVLTVWPLDAGPKAWAWTYENVSIDMIKDLDWSFSFGKGERNFQLAFAFDEASLKVHPEFPELRNLSGSAVLRPRDFQIDVENAEIPFNPSDGFLDPLSEGATLLVGPGRISFPNTTERPVPLKTDIWIKGSSEVILAALNHQPMQLLKNAKKEEMPRFDGEVRGRLMLDLPIMENLLPEDLKVAAEGELSDFSVYSIYRGEDFKADSLDFSVNQRRLSVSGFGEIDDQEIEIVQYLPFADVMQHRLMVYARADQSDLAEFGLVPERIALTDEAPIEMSLRFPQKDHVVFRIASDLEGAELEFPELGLRKSPDDEGSILVEGYLIDKKIDDLEFDVTLPDGSFKGQQMGDRLKLSELRLGTRFRGNIMLQDDQPPLIEADLVDLRDFSKEETSAPFSGELMIKALRLSENLALHDLKGTLEDSTGELMGLINNQSSVQIKTERNDGAQSFVIESDDAGEAIRNANIFDGAYGGKMRLRLDEIEGGYQGKLDISEIRVDHNSPLASLLNAASFVGLLDQLVGPGIYFSSLRCDITFKRQYFTFENCNAIGPSIGLTGFGYYAPLSKEIDLRGAITPIYFANGVMERALGPLMGRERGEGLVSLYYRMRGDIKDPRVTANPISVLLPGIFRRLIPQPMPDTK